MSQKLIRELARVCDEEVLTTETLDAFWIFARAIEQAVLDGLDPQPKPSFAEALAIVDEHYKEQYEVGFLDVLRGLAKAGRETRETIGHSDFLEDDGVTQLLKALAEEVECIGDASACDVQGQGEEHAATLRDSLDWDVERISRDDIPDVDDFLGSLEELLKEDKPETTAPEPEELQPEELTPIQEP